ncbi:MAG TPA: hypothetical protein VHG93_11255 [Longimicrobium sp.]|nr:hypothetical protein [Longimicrobium sp.]
MDTRRRIFWLNLQQTLVVLIGFGVFIGIRRLFERAAFDAWFDATARVSAERIVTGEEVKTFWETPVGAALPVLGLLVIFVLGRNAASVFYRAGRERRQIKRNLKAELLLERLKQGSDEPFSLYLRSFAHDGFTRRKGFWWYVLAEGDVSLIDRETLELLISQRMRMRCPMIALGPPGDKLGAGRLATSEAEWKEITLFLMDRARFIFIVPGASEGVLWEIRHLARDHYAKTRYIMPPAKFMGDAARAEELWDEARLPCIPRGIDLPRYDPRGAQLIMDANGRVAETLRI